MKTRNLNLDNFSTSNCEIIDNNQLITLMGGADPVVNATTTSTTTDGDDGTILPDPMIWIKG
ncbi:MAG TPA: hypothetical protein VMV56_00940 [Williamwhitmania sp.]|nr:hypothetical protein [Williamwhitmania sp.]